MNLTPEGIQKDFGIALNQAQIDKLQKHYRLVMHVNEYMNLTRFKSEEDAIEYHIKDSLSAVPLVNRCMKGRFIDIGTGAGYPGIPIAIATGRRGVLLDSTAKKIKAVNYFIKELGLEDQLVGETGRAEEYALDHRGQFQVAIARAVTSIAAMLELASPLLAKGGCLIVMKGTPNEEEIDGAQKNLELVGMHQVDEVHFELGPDCRDRSLYVYEKYRTAPIKLPRAVGRAQHKPLYEEYGRKHTDHKSYRGYRR